MVVINNLPFKETLLNDTNEYIEVIRTFSINSDNKEFVWHLDKENRLIKIIESDNWFFQFENELPFKLINNNEFLINKNTWHRIINNNSTKNLIVNIKKYK